MATPVIGFTPNLLWVDVPNPNEPPEQAQFITAGDLMRYEHFGRDASALLNTHDAAIATLRSDLTSGLSSVNSAAGTTNTNLNNLTTKVNNATTGLDSKAPKANPTFTGTVSGISKAMVGLGSVDNTADAAKPVSTAQKTYIDAVGSRVTTIEASQNARRLLSRGLPAFSIGGTDSEIVSLPSFTVKAGVSYKITMAWKGYASVADVAIEVYLRSAAVGTTGIKTTDPLIFSTTAWSHPSRQASGMGYTLGSIWTPAAAGTFRLYLHSKIVVNSSASYTFSTNDQPFTLLIEEKGDLS